MTSFKLKTMNVHDLKKQYDADSDLCLIDVREDHEWHDMRIPRALHIPKDTLASIIAEKIADQSTPIYLYCRGGVRSLSAAQTLIDLGYQDVYSINGGIVEWVHAGYPVAC